MLNHIFHKNEKIALFTACSFFISNVGVVCFASTWDADADAASNAWMSEMSEYTSRRDYGRDPDKIWTPEEYRLLRILVERYKHNWEIISRKMIKAGYNRDIAECWKRYSTRIWASEEHQLLRALAEQYKPNWETISLKMIEAGYNRDPNECRERYDNEKEWTSEECQLLKRLAGQTFVTQYKYNWETISFKMIEAGYNREPNECEIQHFLSQLRESMILNPNYAPKSPFVPEFKMAPNLR
ncbi:MAG: myb/SANT-like DNA-binding domain-containing protein [Puniceicoccales bacterium]|jgi:hypothetical protein|nr:myb/SANT-like DNA-binding domain-containing protein [Puniceicoccales bacterium]